MLLKPSQFGGPEASNSSIVCTPILILVRGPCDALYAPCACMFVSLACILASPSPLYLALPCLHTLFCSRHPLAHLAVAPFSQHA